MQRLHSWILLPACLYFFVFSFPALARTPSDFLYTQQWYLEALRSPEAWDTSTGSSNVIVAVLDAGVDLDHPDLAENLWKNTGEIPGDGVDNDHNGFEDDYDGWDFVDADGNPSPDVKDVFSDAIVSHGTLVAGLIGAVGDNGKGIAGMAWEVRVMPLRVLQTDGSGSTYDVRRAIHYAVENGADIINLSFTTTEYDADLLETMRWAYAQGVVLVASAGNENADLLSSPVYPACYDLFSDENIVIGVGSTDRMDAKASFSNYGKGCVDLSAPGVDILGTVYQDTEYLLFSTPYGGPWEGTSVSAPLVSGAIALMKAVYPALTPKQIVSLLRLSADPIQEASSLARQALGNGRLNVADALDAARQLSSKGEKVMSSEYLSSWMAVTFGKGSAPVVYEVSKEGMVTDSFLAYAEDFLGGVRTAVADTDGDGDAEIITGAGPGGGPQVRVFDPDGRVLAQFFAFEEESRSGIFVASGDVNGDGEQEIIVSQDKGGGGQVRFFSRDGVLLGSFRPFDRTDAAIRIASGNIDEDAADELVVSAMKDGETWVHVYEGTGKYVRSLDAPVGWSTQERLISVGDADGDSADDIIVSSGEGGVARVFVHSALGALQQSFIAYPLDFTGGVQTVVGDLDQNGESELYTFPVSQGGPHVRVFGANGEVIGGFFVGDETSRFGGTIAL